MTTQLTLISVPAELPHPPADRDPDGSPVAEVPAAAERVTAIDTGRGRTRPVPHRRAVGHTGWLDAPTIDSGRRGVAAARAALADAHQRVVDRQAAQDADRTDRLVRQARDLADHGHAA